MTSVSDDLARDLLATIATFIVAWAWLRMIDALAARGRIEPRLSRKIIHLGTGPLFVLMWLSYSSSPQARVLAAMVPLLVTAQFVLVGLGLIQDDSAGRGPT